MIFIQGRRGTGKTDLGFKHLEVLHKYGLIVHFCSNTKVTDTPFPIEFITNMEDLEYWCKTIPGRKVFLFDEMGRSFKKRSPMAKLNLKIIEELQTMRKYKLSIIGIAPSDKYVDSTALGSDMLDASWEKPIFNNPKVAHFHDELEENETTFTGIPATSVKFGEWDVATFVLHSPKAIPKFNDKDKQTLWDWSHGKTAKDLGLERTQIARITRNFVKDVLERESNK